MERHFAYSVLVRLFSGQEPEPEAATAIPHLTRCQRCWDLAVRVVTDLRTEGRLAQSDDARGAILILLAGIEEGAINRLRARAWWVELKNLSPPAQLARIKADPTLRTFEMFRIIVEEAASSAMGDPYVGEETARIAYALVCALQNRPNSEPYWCDLQCEALAITANCRRLASDWQGAAEILRIAKGTLQRGTAEPAQEARLLSLEASLLSDTGHMEKALSLLGRAAEIYRRAENPEAIASVIVKEAGILLASCSYEEAILQAETALQWLSPAETRLTMLARNIITEALVALGHPEEALRAFHATENLFRLFSCPRVDLRRGFLEAILLEALGHPREADKLFRCTTEGFFEAELYKDALMTLLTHFEALFRRGALGRARQVCEDALERIEKTGKACHSQVTMLWRDLLTLVEAQRLTQEQLLVARHYLGRHWTTPARHAPLELSPDRPASGNASERKLPPKLDQERLDATWCVHLVQDRERKSEEPSFKKVTSLCQGGYEEALESYERGLIAAGLGRCEGRINQTANLLGIARNTLRARIEKYKLVPVNSRQTSEPQDSADTTRSLNRLRARAWWTELRLLSLGQRFERLQSVSAIHTREMVEAILAEALALAPNDPQQGQDTALLAHRLASLLSRECCPERERSDLQAAALLAVANCRRLAGDWEGSAAALGSARRHLEQGTGTRSQAARLLSLQASLASDTGHFEQALALLARAADYYRRKLDSAELVSITVKEAGTLLAGGRYEEALSRARAALRLLQAGETRLEILARNIVTESLIYLGRPSEALHSFVASEPLYDQLGGRRTNLRRGFLEAILLEGLGYTRESEQILHSLISEFLDQELYKDAFLTALTYFAAVFRRGALDKAARACAETLALIEEAGEDFHAPMKELFRTLLALVQAQRLQESHLLEARLYLIRSGSARMLHSRRGGDAAAKADVVALPSWVTGIEAAEPPAPEELAPLVPSPPDRWLEVLTPPDPEVSLDELGYKEALARYDRQLIAAGLAQAKGSVREASRLLGIPRNTLRTKLRRYFLTGRKG